MKMPDEENKGQGTQKPGTPKPTPKPGAPKPGTPKQGAQTKGASNAPAPSPSTAPACVSTPNDPNPPCSQHSVVVEFRPLKDYQGEFGFDWLRIYEWAGNGSKKNPFTNDAEEPYIDSADGRGGHVENGVKDARTDLGQAEAKKRIQREYRRFVIKRFPSKPKIEVDYRLLSYFAPYLNLFPEGTLPVTSTQPDASKPFLKLPSEMTLPAPPCEATLQLVIDIKYQIPHEIVLEYDPAYLQISGTTGSSTYYEIASSSSGEQSRYAKGKTPKGASIVKSQYVIKKRSLTPESYAGNVTDSDQIKVKCIKAIPSGDTRIVAYAYDKDGHKAIDAPVGAMIVCANDAAHQKEMKIALVRVDTNIQQDINDEKGNFTTDEILNLFNTLHQALILPDVVNFVKEGNADKEIILDLTKDKKFHTPLIGENHPPQDPSTGEHLKAGCINPDDIKKGFAKYLEKGLNDAYQAYSLPNNYFLAFGFGENGPRGENGITSGKVVKGKVIARSSVSLFPIRGPWTLAHELLHTLQLFHTHRNSTPLLPAQKFIFPHGHASDYGTTNVMSYSKIRYSTWKWQWEIMQNNATNIIR
jgi:hypothetical protein